MKTIEELRSEYFSAGLSATGESPAKIEAIQEVEVQLPNSEALQFLLRVLEDSAEYDLARVEICRVLRVARVSPLDAKAVADVLERGLAVEEDTLIRQWLALASQPFATNAKLYARLAQIVIDAGEEESVRHNALVALESLGPMESSVKILRSIQREDTLSETAMRLLSDWDRM